MYELPKLSFLVILLILSMRTNASDTFTESPFLGDITQFTKVGEKVKGINPGFIASFNGKSYLVKVARGYVDSLTDGPDDSHISEAITSLFFKKVLGESYAPNIYILTRTNNNENSQFAYRNSKTVLASEIIPDAQDEEERLKWGFHQPSSEEVIEYVKIIALVKLLDVKDFKREHVMVSGDRHFIIDCESHFYKSFLSEELMLDPSHEFFEISKFAFKKEIAEKTIKEVVKKFAKLSDEEIENLVKPFQNGPIDGKFDKIKARLKCTRNQAREFIKKWDLN
jgi:hypothetical protein